MDPEVLVWIGGGYGLSISKDLACSATVEKPNTKTPNSHILLVASSSYRPPLRSFALLKVVS